ncbi:hypothetical protein Pint_04506 [Pistacia integerrima]|uniref:Uncharacterized protein n=1 Tax=Pistacia integerrima TaxID=434235 RepID=A0ACC0Z2F8_9ROSI|nr:hypothetical protein Pint_04506 [Pistacia integerrima]
MQSEQGHQEVLMVKYFFDSTAFKIISLFMNEFSKVLHRMFWGISCQPTKLGHFLSEYKTPKVEPYVFLQVIKVDHEAHGVDTAEDVEKIESFMREINLS